MRNPSIFPATAALIFLLASGRLSAHLHHSMCGTGGGDATEIIAGSVPKHCAEGAECVAACAAKEADACYFLGLVFNHAGPGNFNDGMADDYFRQGCDAGSDKACRESGNMDAEYLELEHWQRAKEGWERGCLSGGLHSCAARAGESFTVPSSWESEPEFQAMTRFSGDANRELRKWHDRAVESAAAGCRSAETEACHLLVQLLPEEHRDLPAARDRAARLARLDCAAGDAISCVWVQLDRKAAAINGDLPASPDDDAGTRADELFQRQCDADGNWLDCYNYFTHARRRDEGIEDEVSPFSRFISRETVWIGAALNATCSNRNAGACLIFADLLDRRDAASAVELLARSCSDGSAPACVRLAGKYAEGKGVTQNLAKAVELFEANCGQGGCMMLAAIYGGEFSEPSPVTVDLKRARLYLEQGCREGDQASCREYNDGNYEAKR